MRGPRHDRRARGLAALAGLIAISAGFRVAKARRQAAGPPPRRDWRCSCGQAYAVSGTDRHRIYWLDGRPVVERDCPRCGAPLPAEHETATLLP
jgi:hypothetical protein